jgi:hypothetical protein
VLALALAPHFRHRSNNALMRLYRSFCTRIFPTNVAALDANASEDVPQYGSNLPLWSALELCAPCKGIAQFASERSLCSPGQSNGKSYVQDKLNAIKIRCDC